MSPIFYEPAHLRGRVMATFSNAAALSSTASNTGQATFGVKRQNSQTYLEATISSQLGHNQLYIQAIREIHDPAGSIVFPQGLQGALAFYPTPQSPNNGADGVNGFPFSYAAVDPFANPTRVLTTLSGCPVGIVNGTRQRAAS